MCYFYIRNKRRSEFLMYRYRLKNKPILLESIRQIKDKDEERKKPEPQAHPPTSMLKLPCSFEVFHLAASYLLD